MLFLEYAKIEVDIDMTKQAYMIYVELGQY